METSTATAQSMQDITTTKLNALEKQQQSFEAEKQRILDAVASQKTPFTKVRVLSDAFIVQDIEAPSKISIANIRRFLEQSRHDSSIPSSLLVEWQRALEEALDVPSRKYEHASLFGRLVMEWLGNPNNTPVSTGGSESGDPFEHVGRKEMHDQRREWESIVFGGESKSDPVAIKSYLEDLFGSTTMSKKLTKTPLESLRASMEDFDLGHFSTESLQTCIKGILKTDLLSEPKRKALADFQNNPGFLSEMSDVLNMQIDALDSWTWGEEAVPLEIRRALNGKYRVYMDEEIMQALLLHFIGMKWAVHIKAVLTTFFHSGAWKQSTRKPLDAPARRKRQDYGLVSWQGENVRNHRREMFQSDYFLSQLPTTFDVVDDSYQDDDGGERDDVKNPMSIKQSILHLISTEILINARLHGSLTFLQSDFRWFGPSLPHDTIIAVLRFFGVSDFWVAFMEKFLKAPLKFVHDGPNAQTQVRQCGVPIQHRLGDALGESVLFCLDFAVNKSTESNLYRMHDDLWFWGSSDAAVAAWETIQEFTDVMGLTLNEGKTGSVHISSSTDPPNKPADSTTLDKFPPGQVRWGFLILDSTGRWNLDDAQVDNHIREMQTQLKACKSIFAWVQAWNIYVARFVSNNFGEAAHCLGRAHLDMVIAAFEKIQRKIFDTDDMPGDNVTSYLKAKLAERFGVRDLPDGFVYLPIELGGLGLRNPFIPLFLVHADTSKEPMQVIEMAFEREEEAYNKAKKAFEDGTSRSRFHPTSPDVDSFMSLEEYVRYAEETSTYLQQAYVKLLSAPEKTWIGLSNDVADARHELPRGVDGDYNDWVLQLYGDEIIRRYGGLAMGDKRLLPIGLVSMLRGEKVRWQG